MSRTVIETVASAAGRSPLELAPLTTCLEPDALDALVRTVPAQSRSDLQVSFRYEGFTVTVTGDGCVEAHPGPDW